MHTSQYTMGADVADINNDGFPEIISTDMLPYDPYILKRSLGGDDYDIFKYKTSVGYSPSTRETTCSITEKMACSAK
ncbi:MAG: hypothetical protein WDO16_00330 [Bacteroidota bacterium]